MTIMESAIEMNNSYVDCTNSLDRIGLFSEASYKEYEINLKEIALKVLKENGTEEDFDFLATEAAKDYIERAKKAIKKIIDAVIKFIKKCKDNLIKLVTQEKTSSAIEKAEEACKANPKLRSQKIEYHNTDKQINVLKQNLDKVRKKVTKVKAKGVATDADSEEIREIEIDLNKKVAAVATISSVSFAVAIKLFKDTNSKSEIDNNISDDMSDLEFEISANTAQSPETASFFVNAVQLMGKIKKEIATKVSEAAVSLLSGIKDGINKLKGVTTSENLETESGFVLEDLKMFSYVTEAAKDDEEVEETKEPEANVSEGLNLDDYFEELCDDLFKENSEEVSESEEPVETEEVAETTDTKVEEVETESTEIEEITETTDTKVEEVETESTESDEDMAKTYMEQLESELFGDGEVTTTESTNKDDESETVDAQTYMEQMEAELFGDGEVTTTESTNKDDESETVDSQTYMEQMEAELFGTDEDIVEESTIEEETEDSVSSLLDEMEKLLDM